MDHIVDFPKFIKQGLFEFGQENPIKLRLIICLAVLTIFLRIAVAYDMTYVDFIFSMDIFDYIENSSYVVTVIMVLYSI